jgi:hypothetical protein
MKNALRTPRRILVVGIVVAGLTFSACHRHAATLEDCRAVIARLVELELSESGYRDPVLRARWQQDLGRRFAPDLDRCRGLKVPNDLRRCIAAARTPEEIAHRCLD